MPERERFSVDFVSLGGPRCHSIHYTNESAALEMYFVKIINEWEKQAGPFPSPVPDTSDSIRGKHNLRKMWQQILPTGGAVHHFNTAFSPPKI